MQQVIEGTDPERIEEIEEAALAFARLKRDAKALKKRMDEAQYVLENRMEEYGLEAYSGHGVRCYLSTERKAKVEVDKSALDDDGEQPKRERKAKG